MSEAANPFHPPRHWSIGPRSTYNTWAQRKRVSAYGVLRTSLLGFLAQEYQNQFSELSNISFPLTEGIMLSVVSSVIVLNS